VQTSFARDSRLLGQSNILNFEIKYQILEEKYELLLYKRYSRISERMILDPLQPLLFTEETAKPETDEKEPVSLQKSLQCRLLYATLTIKQLQS